MFACVAPTIHRPMNIIGICLTSDEGDVIGRTLELALRWCDSIVVIDHDSSDATPNVLQELVSQHAGRVHVLYYRGPFNNGIRAIAFNYFRELVAEQGPTWWCRLDSDEVYVDNPREFLNKVPRIYRAVAACSFQFYFTDKDLVRYQGAPEKYRDGNAIETLDYYSCNSTELRFFRDEGQPWLVDEPWPKRDTIYPIYRKFIRLKHYQYRYPEQISDRLKKRSSGFARKIFKHEMRAEWLRETVGGQGAGTVLNASTPAEPWESRVVSCDQLRSIENNSEFEIDRTNIKPIPSLARQIASSLVRKCGRAAEPFAIRSVF